MPRSCRAPARAERNARRKSKALAAASKAVRHAPQYEASREISLLPQLGARGIIGVRGRKMRAAAAGIIFPSFAEITAQPMLPSRRNLGVAPGAEKETSFGWRALNWRPRLTSKMCKPTYLRGGREWRALR